MVMLEDYLCECRPSPAVEAELAAIAELEGTGGCPTIAPATDEGRRAIALGLGWKNGRIGVVSNSSWRNEVSRRPDGSYEHGNFDAFNPKSHAYMNQREAAERNKNRQQQERAQREQQGNWQKSQMDALEATMVKMSKQFNPQSLLGKLVGNSLGLIVVGGMLYVVWLITHTGPLAFPRGP